MLKHFLKIMGRYLKPYRKYLVGSVLLNFFSQWMNVFSFVVLIPILNILFKIDQTVYTYKEWTWDTLSKETVVNNGYAFVQELAEKFRRENGSLICAELLGLRERAPQPPTPEERTQTYYVKRPCVKMVEIAAQIWAKRAELE